jgi:hypothetical protein
MCDPDWFGKGVGNQSPDNKCLVMAANLQLSHGETRLQENISTGWEDAKLSMEL